MNDKSGMNDNQRTELYFRLKKNRVMRLIQSFIYQARHCYYERYQDRYLSADFINELSDLDAHIAELRAEIDLLNYRQLNEVERRHLELMSEMGMDVDDREIEKNIEDLIRQHENVMVRQMCLHAWRYGDQVAQHAIVDYLNGNAAIQFDYPANEHTGGTVMVENGKTVYRFLPRYEQAADPVSFAAATLLFSHAAHRAPGISEDRSRAHAAILSDVLMAKKMIHEFGEGYLDHFPAIKALIAVYDSGGINALRAHIEQALASADDFAEQVAMMA